MVLRARRASERGSRGGCSRWASGWTRSPRARDDRRAGARGRAAGADRRVARSGARPRRGARPVRRGSGGLAARRRRRDVAVVEVDGVPLRPPPASPSTRRSAAAREPLAARRTAAGCGPSGSRTTTPSGARRAGVRVGDRDADRDRDGHLGFLTVFGYSEDLRWPAAEFQTLEAIAATRGRDRGAQRDASARAGAGRRRRADGARQPPGAPRDARARGRAGAPPRAAAGRLRLDIDDFKRTNTRVGQLEGDAILVEIADAAARDAPSRPTSPIAAAGTSSP